MAYLAKATASICPFRRLLFARLRVEIPVCEGRLKDLSMNAVWTDRQPYLALIDDDPESARLLTRMLLAHGAPSIRWLQNEEEAVAELSRQLSDRYAHVPELVIVDLKSAPDATSSMVRTLRALPYAHYLLIATLAHSPTRRVHDAHRSAGADAVVVRVADTTDCRREAAKLVSLWVRNQRLNAIGA
jgi:CheY-like chemotaxis protein